MGKDRSYAETINSAKVMLSGLKSNADRVSKRGAGADFVTKFESAFAASQTLDSEQEDLKAKLKTKTAALDAKVGELEKLMSEARKVVKLEMEKESWKSFGIADAK
jgi:hypothetical protein